MTQIDVESTSELPFVFTSVGAGTSILPVRLNCPPEITLHTLRAMGAARKSVSLGVI